MTEQNTIVCLKNDPDLVFSSHEVYVVIDIDPDTWMPIVGLATNDNQKEVGVVVVASAKGFDTVSLRFGGVAIVRVSVPTGNADPGVSLGVKASSKIATLFNSGIGIILRQLDLTGTERLVLANLSSGETTIRWKKFETV